jgi:hypothetical protein
MSEPFDQDTDAQRAPIIGVECYAGHRADVEPRSLHLGERHVTVNEVIDRWLDPRHRYFKLRGDDGDIYLVRHDTVDDRWELTMHHSARRGQHRLSST